MQNGRPAGLCFSLAGGGVKHVLISHNAMHYVISHHALYQRITSQLFSAPLSSRGLRPSS